MVVYLMLAGGALFGDRVARLAAMFGGVAALAIVLSPITPAAPGVAAGKPLILSFIDYLTQMINTGSAGTLTSATAKPTTTTGSATSQPAINWSNPLFWGSDILKEANKLTGAGGNSLLPKIP
jgi:hypothetical protein